MGALSSSYQPVPSPRFKFPSELIPLSAAFLTISFAFGVLAREAGLGLGVTVLMTSLVYAGTSQVVALGLLATHQPAWVIILVTLLINSRLLLMASVMVEPTAKWKRFTRFLFAFQLTDETFALLLASAGGLATPQRALWIQGAAYLAWVLGTILGFALDADSSQLRGFGIDFALVAMMLAVLVLQLRDIRGIAVALAAGAVAVVVTHWGWAWAAPLSAAFLAPAVGIWMEKRWITPKYGS